LTIAKKLADSGYLSQFITFHNIYTKINKYHCDKYQYLEIETSNINSQIRKKELLYLKYLNAYF